MRHILYAVETSCAMTDVDAKKKKREKVCDVCTKPAEGEKYSCLLSYVVKTFMNKQTAVAAGSSRGI